MNAKLTLKLDQEAIELAKRYAQRRGVSLSRVVENYFLGLTTPRRSEEEPQGLVAELAGLLRGVEVDESGEEYADHLTRKYS